MDSSEEIGDYDNTTIGGIWSAFSWDRRDIRADDLPMMNSIAWPLGESFEKSCLSLWKIQAFNLLQVVFIQMIVFFKQIFNLRDRLHEYCRDHCRNAG